MQGVILDEMRMYIAQQYGYRAWVETLKKAGREPTRQYSLDEVYPDEELGRLAASAAAVTGTPPVELLKGFGEAMVPDMMRVYSYLVEPDWSYIDFLMNMEPLLHKALQLHTAGALPAKVHAQRKAADAIRINYSSPLKACAAVEGVIVGAAKEYGVKANVVQSECVLRGNPECVFDVAIQPRA